MSLRTPKSPISQSIVFEGRLLDYPTNILLSAFGAGQPTPGSGAAAALSGLMAARMLECMCRLTGRTKRTKQRLLEAEYVAGQITVRFEPGLQSLFNQDVQSFKNLIKIRAEKKVAKSVKSRQRLAKSHSEQLHEVTAIPLRIAELCSGLGAHGLTMYDVGYEEALGECAGGVFLAIAGMRTALSAASLNLTKAKNESWAIKLQQRCEELWEEAGKLQTQIDRRLQGLRDEAAATHSGQFDLFGPKLTVVEGTKPVRVRTSKSIVPGSIFGKAKLDMAS